MLAVAIFLKSLKTDVQVVININKNVWYDISFKNRQIFIHDISKLNKNNKYRILYTFPLFSNFDNHLSSFSTRLNETIKIANFKFQSTIYKVNLSIL